jgi:UDP-2,4-diacetamido-2,4,6-trideoxy-beta-L-altropyranose hydrolase
MADYSLLIRSDANTIIGTGHVMRCLALAQACMENGGTITFLMAPGAPALEERIRSEGMKVRNISESPGSNDDATVTGKYANDIGSQWIVVDGYHFGAEYQKKLKECGCRVLFIDDFGHSDHYYADIVLNQNINADSSCYQKTEFSTQLLLGTKFVLLRKEFLKWTNADRKIPDVAKNVLVTFGGGDSDNITQNVINALKQIRTEGLEVISVIGGVNPHAETLCQSVMDHPHFSIMTDITNISDLMEWADIAISSGGSTCWELAFMGLPSIIVPVAQNQKPHTAALKANGLIKCIEMDEIVDPEVTAKKIQALLLSHDERSSLSHSMKGLIDGRGSFRVVLHMSSYSIRMRPVEKSDCDRIFLWINDDKVRKNSFHPEKISIEDHKQWFSSVFKEKKLEYYIALDMYNRPIGQARFKIEGEDAVISILLDNDHRGMNLGSKLIRIATTKFFDDTRIKKVHAYIKTTNEKSLKAFIHAGYTPNGYHNVEGKLAHHLIISRCE